MLPPKAQDEPQTQNPFHNRPALGPGEEVSSEAIPVYRRARRILQLSQPDRDPGEDLVPEPKSEGQAAAGGRAGEAQNDPQTHLTSRPDSAVSTLYADPDSSLVRTVVPLQQTHAALCTCKNILHTAGIQHVSTLQRRLLCGVSLEDLLHQIELFMEKHFWLLCWTYTDMFMFYRTLYNFMYA